MGRTRFLKTNCVFKCIVKMSNGMHKVVRMTIDKVATFAAAMRCLRECPWLTRRYEDFFSELGINYRNVESCRFQVEGAAAQDGYLAVEHVHG